MLPTRKTRCGRRVGEGRRSALSASLDKRTKKDRYEFTATVGSATPAARAAAIASLQQLLGDRLSTAASILEGHGKDASYHPCVPPDAVAFARSTEEVSETVKICARHKVPLIPLWKRHRRRGQCRSAKGGVSLDLSQMNRILQVSTGDQLTGLETGYRRVRFVHRLQTKLFFVLF